MLDNYLEYFVLYCISGFVNDWILLDFEKWDENKSGFDSLFEKYMYLIIKKLKQNELSIFYLLIGSLCKI